jgi:hypothetical protein
MQILPFFSGRQFWDTCIEADVIKRESEREIQANLKKRAKEEKNKGNQVKVKKNM